MKEYTAFLNYLAKWIMSLENLKADDVFAQPEHTAILSVDVINGFCKSGNLASELVATIIQPIVRLFKLAWDAGVRNIVLSHDCHTPHALEFNAYPPHAICGTEEAEAVNEIKKLAFYDQMIILHKNSIAPAQNTRLNEWIEIHPEITTFIIVGDCTDICTYLLAIHMRTYANAYEKDWRVIVPED